jgi:hypothetical protein
MKKIKMLFVLGILAIIVFGFSQVTSACEMSWTCDFACGYHECSATGCDCPPLTPNAGHGTTCAGWHNGECGDPPWECWDK